MGQIFEAIMLICFGISWPISLVKSIKSKTAKGKSVIFTIAITVGYISGIIGKIVSENITYVFWLYVINLTMIVSDLIVTFINKRRDKRLGERLS